MTRDEELWTIRVLVHLANLGVPMDWNLADAEDKLTDLVERALEGEPQRVVRHDDAVVVVAEEEYERLRGRCRTAEDVLSEEPDLSVLNLV